MKLVISPAKSLDFESTLPTAQYSYPLFEKEAARINADLRKKTVQDIAALMDLSPKLSQLNWERNQEFGIPFTPENARPAVYAFNGDVYTGLDAYSIPSARLGFMQDSVRILSGLYGILRPLDLVQPYRLEMGTSFGPAGKKNLYDFWSAKITGFLNAELEGQSFLLNLASKEYFSAIDRKKLIRPVVDVQFKDYKGGKLKVISFFAKKARGSMVRYIIDHEIQTLEGLKAFDADGYRFAEELSKENKELVFVR